MDKGYGRLTPMALYNQKQRAKAIEILGGKCVGCGVKNVLVLCVDHKEPVKGNTIKRGRIGETGPTMYNKIIKSKEERERYQLLCRNCNWLKMIEKGERQTNSFDYVYTFELEALRELVKRNHIEVLRIKARLENSKKTKEEKTKAPSIQQLGELLYPLSQKILREDGRIDAKKMRYELRKQLELPISVGRSYDVKEWLENEYPKEFIKNGKV